MGPISSHPTGFVPSCQLPSLPPIFSLPQWKIVWIGYLVRSVKLLMSRLKSCELVNHVEVGGWNPIFVQGKIAPSKRWWWWLKDFWSINSSSWIFADDFRIFRLLSVEDDVHRRQHRLPWKHTLHASLIDAVGSAVLICVAKGWMARL